jgi:hypothetical protein
MFHSRNNHLGDIDRATDVIFSQQCLALNDHPLDGQLLAYVGCAIIAITLVVVGLCG